MRVAIFGESNYLSQLRDALQKNPTYFGDEIEFACVIQSPPQYKQICANPFSDLRSIQPRTVVDVYQRGLIDAVVTVYHGANRDQPLFFEIQNMIRYFKLNGIKRIAVLDCWYTLKLKWLDPRKFFLSYIETSVIDGCNLNCRGCVDFSSLFSRDEIYDLNKFERDLKDLSEKIDLSILRLLGGEPLLLKNLDEYLRIARRYFPQTNIAIVTNGLLIPTLSDKIFDAIRETESIISISEYPPTTKIKSKIIDTLEKNKVLFQIDGVVREFRVFIRNKSTRSNPHESIKHCMSSCCYFLSDGKLHKCQTDALAYRYAERFPNDSVCPPPPSSIPIDSPNFLELLDYVMQPWNVIPMCEFCSDENVFVPWRIENHPTSDDWKS